MIEINLLPGVAAKKSRRAAPVRSSADEGRAPGALDGLRERLRDKYLLAAVACLALCIAGVGGLYTTQQAEAASLAERETSAVGDSAKFATLIAERKRMTAERDSLQRSLAVIATIDSTRYIWPHVLDEVSRALPIYTWLTAVQQTSGAPTPDGAAKTQGTTRTAPNPPAAKPAADSTARAALRFRVTGHTVDIQALTRFMRDLEASPFVKNVQLGSSQTVLVDNKDVTEFTLDAEYEAPDRALLRTAPLTVVVR